MTKARITDRRYHTLVPHAAAYVQPDAPATSSTVHEASVLTVAGPASHISRNVGVAVRQPPYALARARISSIGSEAAAAAAAAAI